MNPIQHTNIFAALGEAKKKKKGALKSKDGGEKKKKASKAERSAELERAIFDGPKVSITNWADTDEDSDADAPLPDTWGEVGSLPCKYFAGVCMSRNPASSSVG
jgi:hypothetical protein